MPTLGPLGDPRHRAEAGQRHRAGALAGQQGVRGDLAHRVPGPRAQQRAAVGRWDAVRSSAVQDHPALEHRLVVLGDEVGPGRVRRVVRCRHRQPAAGRVPIREDVHPPVPADVQRRARVDALLHDPQRRRVEAAVGQVGQPQVVARCGAGGCADDEPPAVHRHGDAVVVGHVQPGAQHLDVGLGVGADPVQPDPPVVLRLVRRHQLGAHPAYVVERLAAGQPRDRRVAGPVDRALDRSARHDVDDVQHRLLGAAGGELVGEQVALLGRLPRVQGGGAGCVDGDRVDEHPLGAVRVDGEQHRVLLLGRAAHEELAVAAPGRGAHGARAEQLPDPFHQPLAAGQTTGLGLQQRVLRERPRDRLRAVRVLQPAVGVADEGAVQGVGVVGPAGLGVGGARHGRHCKRSVPGGGSRHGRRD